MPAPTPFHPRTSELCTSLLYKEWAGCYAVRRYDTYHEREYYSLRHAATVMDATPLYKYAIHGPDAAEFLSWVSVRDMGQDFAVGRVAYVAWCDPEGKVLDDGTITRLGQDRFRMTSADPAYGWLVRHAQRFDVQIEDESRRVAALALQGPRSRDVLRELVGAPADELRFFRATSARLGDFELGITRTGYTGDLGYELWCENEHALALWDALFEAGRPLGLAPLGLDALDVARVEAGFVLGGVDYVSARRAQIEAQKATPYELGFDWMVRLDRAPFIGQAALKAEKARGPARRFVGLDVDWEEFEALHAAQGLPPHLPAEACREGVPVYHEERQVGQATTRAWSPSLKRYLALATVRHDLSRPGTALSIEVTVEYRRHRAAARVLHPPFFDPERKKS